jgi:Integrase core domain
MRGLPRAYQFDTTTEASPCHGRFRIGLRFLGIASSPTFVRAPEGNSCAERFIRTLKGNLLWMRRFETIEALRQDLLAFRGSYNSTWLIARHGFQTPKTARHKQLPFAVLAAEASTGPLKAAGGTELCLA